MSVIVAIAECHARHRCNDSHKIRKTGLGLGDGDARDRHLSVEHHQAAQNIGARGAKRMTADDNFGSDQRLGFGPYLLHAHQEAGVDVAQL